MKPAREILLARNHDAVPALDRIRRGVVASLPARPEPRSAWSPFTWIAVLWEQLVLPSRYAWAGLAVTWFVIIILQVMTADRSSATRARQAACPAKLLEEARARRELQAELLGVGVTGFTASPPTSAEQGRAPRAHGGGVMGAMDEQDATSMVA